MSLFARIRNGYSAFRAPLAPSPPARPQNQITYSTPFGTGSTGLGSSAAVYGLKQLHEMRPYDRREAIKSSRYLDNNLGIAGLLNDGSVNYAIGSGISDFSNTGDPDFDASADRFLQSIWESSSFDVAQEQTFPELQKVICRAMIVDGDMGIAKILRKDRAGRDLGPQIQLFTSDQIGDGDGKGLYDGERMLEGVARDAFGAATRYRILKDQGQWDYQAKDFLLVQDRKRIALNRGMPWCHRSTRAGVSLLDLTALEEQAAYVNAMFAAIVTTPTGETPEAMEEFITQAIQSPISEPTAGSPEQKKVYQKFLKLMGGAKIPVFPEGTKLQAYHGNRGSTNFIGHMQYLVSLLAAAYGVPVNFIWTIAGGTGPETRMTLAQAQWYFNYIVVLMIRRGIKPLRDWLLQYGLLTGKINDGRLPRNGAHYGLARYHGPRDITIDERYYHKTYLDRLAQGQGTSEEYHSLQGQDGRAQNFRRIDEIAELKKRCAEKGVAYMGEFIQTAPGQQTGATNKQDDDAEDESGPPQSNPAP